MAIRRHKASGSRSNRGKNGAQKPGGLSLGTARHPARHEEPPPAIGEYLIRRLQDYGIRDVFGIPGDYVLPFYKMLEESPIRVDRHDAARTVRAFAADAYARVNGMGAVCVTYCVGGPEPLQLHCRGVCREVAGGRDQRLAGPVASAIGIRCCTTRSSDFDTQFEVFEKITVASARARRPVDRVSRDRPRASTRPSALQAAGLSRASPRPRRAQPAGHAASGPPSGLPPSDPDALARRVDEAAAR